MSSIGRCLLALTLLLLASGATAGGPQPRPEQTHVEWRRHADGTIHVTGSRRGTRLKEATALLQSVADRLDCLRTHVRHVRWSRLSWRDGRVQGTATAESALYGNVALLSLRDLLPGRATAGSGVQQIRTRSATPRFRVRILVGLPPAQQRQRRRPAGDPREGR